MGRCRYPSNKWHRYTNKYIQPNDICTIHLSLFCCLFCDRGEKILHIAKTSSTWRSGRPEFAFSNVCGRLAEPPPPSSETFMASMVCAFLSKLVSVYLMERIVRQIEGGGLEKILLQISSGRSQKLLNRIVFPIVQCVSKVTQVSN